jgi:nicotinamidase-related amidase
MLMPEAQTRREAAVAEGSDGQQLWRGLDVRLEDGVVRKYRFSAFWPGASDLAKLLRARGVDTAPITGLVTNACCQSSARDAMMLNFRTIMVSGANAATTSEEHRASRGSIGNARSEQDRGILLRRFVLRPHPARNEGEILVTVALGTAQATPTHSRRNVPAR